MDLGLEGRRVAIGGATGGLGLMCARMLAREGAKVCIAGRDPNKVRDTVTKLGEKNHSGVIVDLAVPAEAARFVREARRHFDGGPDIVIVNGPGPSPGNAREVPPDAYQDALNSSLLSVVHMCSEAIPAMISQGWGRIVAITSLSARQPLPGMVLSNTARAGATGYLKSLASEVARFGVTVNTLQPGLHLTERLRKVYGDQLDDAISDIPAARAGTAAEFAAVATFLCSGPAGYLTGVSLPIDGGLSAGLN